MPECPLTDFSYGSTKYTHTTTSSTIAQSSTPTLPLKPVTKAAAVNKTEPTSLEQIESIEEAQVKPTTTRPLPKAGKQTSSDTSK